MSKLSEVYSSAKGSIYSYTDDNGKCRSELYLENLSNKDQDKFFYLFEWLCREGKIYNKEKFRHLEEGIYEFKHSDRRLLSFFLHNTLQKSLVLTHGFTKKRGKTPRGEIKKAMYIRGIILDEINQKKIKMD